MCSGQLCAHPRMHVLTYTVAHTPNIMQLHAEARAHSYGPVYTHSWCPHQQHEHTFAHSDMYSSEVKKKSTVPNLWVLIRWVTMCCTCDARSCYARRVRVWGLSQYHPLIFTEPETTPIRVVYTWSKLSWLSGLRTGLFLRGWDLRFVWNITFLFWC